jgi:hypothetical protein
MRVVTFGCGWAGLLLVAGLLLSACMAPPLLEPTRPATATSAQGSGPTPENAFATSESVSDLMSALEERGASVQWAGTVNQSFFSVPGWLIRVNGQEVEVYEYVDQAARLSDAIKIAADGLRVADTAVEGPGQPTFWTGGNLIVLFLGDMTEVPELLSGILGDPLTRPGAGAGPAIVLAPSEAATLEASTAGAGAAPAPVEPAALPAPDEIPVLLTNVTEVLASKDVTIYRGPSADYESVGDLLAGARAKVTGVSADGNWWRIVCTDDSDYSCWVTADMKRTKVVGAQ